ncbi:MAG: SHOCT domain-containing protein [Actinobacteria bacterium]|nr:SHOCT domain-containing protein [Actinomycetota bacterium]
MMWGWPMMGGFFGGGLGWIGMIFGFIFFVAIIIGIIFLIVWLVRRTGYSINDYSITDKTSTHSLEILKERYAKGELTKEQYENMKKELMP